MTLIYTNEEEEEAGVSEFREERKMD